MECVSMPKAVYIVEKEMTERKEARLCKIIVALIVAWFLTATGITAGFLWYLNQYDFEAAGDEYYQDVDTGENGNVTITDGVHYGERQ